MSDTNIKPVKLRSILIGGTILGAVAVTIAVTGITTRAHSEAELSTWTAEQAIPTVTTVSPAQGQAEEIVTLPGTIQAFNTASIYPRATGYIRNWTTDIGSRVKAGTVLATIDSPDLDQQLLQARGALTSAEANAKLASVTAGRWSDLAKTYSVSEQAKDEKVFDASAKIATMEASKSAVHRLEDLASFKNVTAPFDGIVTARNVDIGNLVSADGTSSKPLFEVADIHKVRVYVQVPQSFLEGLTPGLKATLDLPQYPNAHFSATLVSTSNAVSVNTRSALVELEADNKGDKLWPGAFTEVRFRLPTDPHMLLVPTTALIFEREGVKVAKLGADGRVSIVPVGLGRNLGTDVEVVSGLSPEDHLVNNPSEALESGDKVALKTPDPAAPAPLGAANAAAQPDTARGG